MATKTLVATTSFACTVGDVERTIRENEIVNATDPVVTGREQLFAAQ